MKKHGKERLIEKKVFITGGASGIGRAICTLFAQEGAQVFIADIDTNGGLETTRLITKRDGVANFQKTDVSNPQSVLELSLIHISEPTRLGSSRMPSSA